jgi:hypothetical protein
MSQFPNMNQPGQPNPFGGGPAAYQQPKSSSPWLWILVGLGGAGLLVCCGCGGFAYYGWTQAMGIVEGEMVRRLNQDPVVQENLGTVTSAKVDLMASGQKSQEAGPGKNVLVFHVVGDKGTGDVIAEQIPGQQAFTNARLVLPGGEEKPLGF